MLSSLDTSPLKDVLADLYDRARRQEKMDARRFSGIPWPAAQKPQQFVGSVEDAHVPISTASARQLYSVVRTIRPPTVVEISSRDRILTLHLAAAVRDNGAGHMFATELSDKAVGAIRQLFVAAGIGDIVTVLDADALDKLRQTSGEVGAKSFEGWKDLYLPVLQLIESRLPSGSLIVAGSADRPGAATYLEYVRNPINGYLSASVSDHDRHSTEFSCRV